MKGVDRSKHENFKPPKTYGKPRPDISLLIPFGGTDRRRTRALKWLIEYWQHELPNAEIVIGKSWTKPFCKTEAFNHAARRARGKVLVLLDADAFLKGSTIQRCAEQIMEDVADDYPTHLWFVPYRRLYRLNEKISEEILASDPANPLRPSDPPPPEDIDGDWRVITYGRRYGAMALIVPRQAFDALGGFDERFRGWGGEDASILRALDTLWGKHKSVNSAVFHLWHPRIGDTYLTRMWPGQKKPTNNKLSSQYHRANRNPTAMRKLVDEGNRASKRSVVRVIQEVIFVLSRGRVPR